MLKARSEASRQTTLFLIAWREALLRAFGFVFFLRSEFRYPNPRSILVSEEELGLSFLNDVRRGLLKYEKALVGTGCIIDALATFRET